MKMSMRSLLAQMFPLIRADLWTTETCSLAVLSTCRHVSNTGYEHRYCYPRPCRSHPARRCRITKVKKCKMKCSLPSRKLLAEDTAEKKRAQSRVIHWLGGSISSWINENFLIKEVDPTVSYIVIQIFRKKTKQKLHSDVVILYDQWLNCNYRHPFNGRHCSFFCLKR